MKTMKAVRIHSYGGPQVLVHEEVLRPQPEQGEVLVRVKAAAVNPVDWKIREGYLKEMLPHSLPLTIGWDVSGVVEETGSGVTRFKIGDEVFSRPDLLRNGTYAEYVVIKETEVAFKPKSVSPRGDYRMEVAHRSCRSSSGPEGSYPWGRRRGRKLCGAVGEVAGRPCHRYRLDTQSRLPAWAGGRRVGRLPGTPLRGVGA